MAVRQLVSRALAAVLTILVAAALSFGSAAATAPAPESDVITAPLDIGQMQAQAIGEYVAWRQSLEAAINYVGWRIQVDAAISYVAARAQADAAAYALAHRRASVSQAPARQAPRAQAVAPSGGSCGGATNGADQFIPRESGGNAYIANGGGTAASPFDAGRAFGCYQIIPSTWASSCSDITTYDPASQAQCASRLPLSAWASSGPTG